MEEYYQQQLLCLTGKVSPASRTAARECRCQWDSIAKPLNGLGEFENMICRIGAIQGTSQVRLGKRAVAVFCGDNGVTAEGVTQTDSSVTAVVTENFARGIASVNRMAALADVDVVPVDLGVAGEIREPGVQNCKIARGTGNIRREPAMTREQALAAIHEGIRLAGELHGSGYDILAAGEMGIGNTTTSGAIVSVMLGEPVEAVTGRGAGLSRAGLEQKIQVIRDAIALHRPDPEDPVQVLADLGGFDIAGITGFLLGGAIYRIPVNGSAQKESGGAGRDDLPGSGPSGQEAVPSGDRVSSGLPHRQGACLQKGPGAAGFKAGDLRGPGPGGRYRGSDAVSAAGYGL